MRLTNTPFDVQLLELVEPSKDTSASNTSQNVGASTLHEGHETLGLDDLDCTIHRTLVLDSFTGCHHHTTTDGIDRVRDQTRCDGHNYNTKGSYCLKHKTQNTMQSRVVFHKNCGRTWKKPQILNCKG